MFDEEIGDNTHVAPIRDKLNKSLSDLVPEVYDEIGVVFQDEFTLSEGGEPDCRPSGAWAMVRRSLTYLPEGRVETVCACADRHQDHSENQQPSSCWPASL